MLESRDLDGQSDLSQHVGQRVHHPEGIGKLVQFKVSKKYAIELDLRCARKGCSETTHVYLVDGPHACAWAYVVEALDSISVVADLRNKFFVCPQHSTKKRTISITLSEALLGDIRQAKEPKESRSKYIERAVASYIDSMEPWEQE